MTNSKSKTKKPGVVQKIIKSGYGPEKVEIAVHGADDLYKEIRIENTLVTEDGEKVKLKQGAEVEVIVEADPKDTVFAEAKGHSESDHKGHASKSE
jgi:hypothetical protein